METVTLEEINENIKSLRLDILELRVRFDEEYELSEEAKKDLEDERKKMKHEFASHEEIMKKYG